MYIGYLNLKKDDWKRKFIGNKIKTLNTNNAKVDDQDGKEWEIFLNSTTS